MNNHSQKTPLHLLMLGAIGVVFGDIGTSPLYAFKECLKPLNGQVSDSLAVLGICSMILWAIFLVVSIKYVMFVMRADNHGEGGILSLMNLANLVAPSKVKKILLILGLFGAATFYGDGVITPAISVLSAIEGIELIQPKLASYILPIAFAIIVGLFFIQKHGTSAVGKLFGPIMVIWFSSLAMMGVTQIIHNPVVLKSINPYYAVSFMSSHPSLALIVFGSVFLALTGGEALYADMGHFGKKPISYAWFFIALPSLVLNYLGQGALILNNPTLVDNPFYSMVPSYLLIPLVFLATFATVIASQAVISGAFSMTKQAIQLGYIPRLTIVHTSEKEIGQIYVPFINWSLFLAVTALLFSFKSSDSLANAYGIAVVTTMLTTTVLMGFVMKYKWNWNAFKLASFMIVFLTVDSLFFGANALKVAEGGYIPLTFAAFIFFMMTTWKTGRKLVNNSLKEQSLDLSSFVPVLKHDTNILHTEGTAVFLNSVVDKTPVSFMHNLKHNHVLHATNIFLSLVTEEVPYVNKEDRLHITSLVEGSYQVVVHLGFKETPDVPSILQRISDKELLENWKYTELETSFFFSREIIQTSSCNEMMKWRQVVFAWLLRNATKASDYFNIPHNRVVELGSQIRL